MRKHFLAIALALTAALSAAAVANADPPVQVAGQSATTAQQSTAASGATQINPSNTNISIRVLSPGNDGDVSQSNTAVSSAAAGNSGSTTQSAGQSQAAGGGIQTSQQSAGTSQLAAALSLAQQRDASNTNVPVRVLSPGNSGSVTQSNTAASDAAGHNSASTGQSSAQSQGGSACECSGDGGVQTADQSAETGQAAGAASAAMQIDPSNTAVSVRVLSPGNDGSVTQSNTAASNAEARNAAATTQDSSQTQAGSGCSCDGIGIQQAKQLAETGQEAGARSAAAQLGASNDASPVRVASPGGGGSVTQSNTTASDAAAGNDAATTQRAGQTDAGSSCRCDGLGIQVLGQSSVTEQEAAALSDAVQQFDPSECGCGGGAGNSASPVRVASRGSDGDVAQNNTAASSALAGNRASTDQAGAQQIAGGGLAIQALGQQAGTSQGAVARSAAAQLDASNDASPVRVYSPGGAGTTTQSNTAASAAAAGNDAATRQAGRQAIAGGCGCGIDPIQVLGQSAGTWQLVGALSAAMQLGPDNASSPTRVASGSGLGSVAQANGSASRGLAGSRAQTAQGASQSG